jgi:hypothetical protein
MTGSGSGSLFASVIEDHLALKRRNGHLDDRMPIDEFVVDDPFENHPLFKTEDDARREEEETGEHPAIPAADTLSLPVVQPVAENGAQGWMETTTDQEFRWE